MSCKGLNIGLDKTQPDRNTQGHQPHESKQDRKQNRDEPRTNIHANREPEIAVTKGDTWTD